MKGLILIPECYRVYIADRENVLFGMIAEKYGWKIEYGRTEKVPTDVDIVIAVNQVMYTKNERLAMMYLADLDKKVKLIGYLGDFYSMEMMLDSKGNLFKEGINDIRMFERYDLILNRHDVRFKAKYPKYVSKTVFFPNFFAPHKRYANLKFNENPIRKCLLLGRLFEPTYPLRRYIYAHRDPLKVDVMAHPGGHPKAKHYKDKRYYIGDRYAQRLNDYFACVTCGGDGGVLTKYLEIPATGSLMLIDDTPDARTIGLYPDEHYVAITKENCLAKIDEVLSNPSAYTEIRKKGRELVLREHSVNNRFETLVNLIKEL